MYPLSNSPASPSDPYFGRAQMAPLPVVLSVLVSQVLLKLLLFGQPFLHRLAMPLEGWSGGLISPSATAGMLTLFVIVGGLILISGSLRLHTLGWDRDGFRIGMLLFIVLVTAGQVVPVTSLIVTTGTVELSTVAPTGQFVAASIENWIGAALGEELIYRGFLLVQIYFLLLTRSRLSRESSLVAAIAVSQVWFGLNHAGSALRMGLAPVAATGYLLHATLVGILLAVLFIRSGSIIVPIVAHGLLNLPISFLPSAVDPQIVMLVLICAAMLVLPYCYSAQSRRFRVPTVLAVLSREAARSACLTSSDISESSRSSF